MNELVTLLLQNKGTRSYRTILMAIVCFGVWKVNEIDKRLAILESRIGPPHYGEAADPKHVADALSPQK